MFDRSNTKIFHSLTSVIVPALNEAELLATTLQRVRANTAPHELIIVDGGSADDTITIAKHYGARVAHSPRRRRSVQLNLGAAEAQGDSFLFLHADTLLPPSAIGDIRSALESATTVGGAFRRRFASSSPWLRVTCELAYWRNRCFGWHLGDQAMFVRRTAFEELNGFQDWPIFEDLDFSRRLARQGRVITLPSPVVSSARRFARRGAWRTSWADFWLTCRYAGGVAPERLAQQRTRGTD